MKAVVSFGLLLVIVSFVYSQPAWQASLDSKIQFYQTTDFGLILAGTQRSLYAIDGQTGERIWRLETGKIGETAVTPVPSTDVVLLSRDLGSKSRLEAVDIMTGASIWQSDKIKGDVLQLAVDPENDLVALVLVKDARGASGSELKRKPIVHVLRLSDGNELWKREFDNEIGMMPARFGDGLGEVAYTLDNYRAPLLLDGRLFLFYEGATSYDARTGKEKEREKFSVNENGLALTEADPVIDGTHIYTSGRGKIRAVDRRTGQVDWKADDLGTASEMALVGDTLFVRTGGRFTRLKDGDTESKGPFGISAIDTASGKTKWRYKGADKGITNFVFIDTRTIVVADNDDVYFIDAGTGKRVTQFRHKTERPEFVLINESGAIVIGGRDEIAAFASERSASSERGARELWRVRHKAPARGAFRIVAGIALRAAAIYFRYGGVATSAFGLARGGLNLANTVNSFRWSGLRSRFGSFDLTTLASSTARDYAISKFYSYGSLAQTPGLLNRISGFQIERPGARMLGRAVPSRSDVRESVLDRLDPVRQAERLSGYLLHKKRLAELHGNYMYFYTDLPKPFDRKGLAGVNVHNGRDGRFVLAGDPDPEFVTDEAVGLLYSADGSRLQAFEFLDK
ncbi:MAG TPA: PQQ-binding-like beta-propeller repeat protein [Pyrinomonadaceae bacterium]|nr:PQQ-binding-like beta-propeller repeat protein [Pyrinomonadaceae bacterium]